jgi:hypothetical protein
MGFFKGIGNISGSSANASDIILQNGNVYYSPSDNLYIDENNNVFYSIDNRNSVLVDDSNGNIFARKVI